MFPHHRTQVVSHTYSLEIFALPRTFLSCTTILSVNIDRSAHSFLSFTISLLSIKKIQSFSLARYFSTSPLISHQFYSHTALLSHPKRRNHIAFLQVSPCYLHTFLPISSSDIYPHCFSAPEYRADPHTLLFPTLSVSQHNTPIHQIGPNQQLLSHSHSIFNLKRLNGCPSTFNAVIHASFLSPQ